MERKGAQHKMPPQEEPNLFPPFLVLTFVTLIAVGIVLDRSQPRQSGPVFEQNPIVSPDAPRINLNQEHEIYINNS